MEEKEPFNGDILIENGKIAAIGKKLEIPADAQVFDASGLEVYPQIPSSARICGSSLPYWLRWLCVRV